MNQEKPKHPVKTLSIRIPETLYYSVSQYALDKEMTSMNSAIIELITTGLREAVEQDRIIGQFILEVIPKEKLRELINVKL